MQNTALALAAIEPRYSPIRVKNVKHEGLRVLQAQAAGEFLSAPLPRSPKDVAALVATVEGTVKTVARQYSRGLSPDDLEDLAAAGRRGAVIAAQRYVVDARGASFGTYAQYWIRVCVIREVFFFWGKGRCGITRTSSTMFYRYGRAKRALEEAGVEVTPEAMAGVLGVTATSLKAVSAVVGSPDDVYEDVGMTSSEDALGELVRRSDVAQLRHALAELDDRSRFVIAERFYRQKRLQVIAEALGVSRQRVCQIENKALVKLRQALSST